MKKALFLVIFFSSLSFAQFVKDVCIQTVIIEDNKLRNIELCVASSLQLNEEGVANTRKLLFSGISELNDTKKTLASKEGQIHLLNKFKDWRTVIDITKISVK